MYYLGIDVGGTNIAAGITDEKGQMIIKDSMPTLGQRPTEEILEDIVSLCLRLCHKSGIGLNRIQAAGIGSPGSVDNKAGIIRYANNVNFKNTNVCAYLKEKLNMDVYIDNDANCAALGEIKAGAAKGFENAIMVTLGTGVGGGIIIGGRIFSGASGIAGEIGHHVIVQGGRECTCKRKGCFEAYASVLGLIQSAKEAIAGDPQSKILEIAGSTDDINGRHIFEAYDLGDKTAINVVNEYIGYLGCGIANLIDILDPEIIILGGGISQQGEKLLKPLREVVAREAYDGLGSKVKIAKAVLGNDAGIIGAALLSLSRSQK